MGWRFGALTDSANEDSSVGQPQPPQSANLQERVVEIRCPLLLEQGPLVESQILLLQHQTVAGWMKNALTGAPTMEIVGGDAERETSQLFFSLQKLSIQPQVVAVFCRFLPPDV